MQSGRDFSLEERAANRGATKAGRNAEEKKRKLPDAGRGARDAKTNSAVMAPETRRRPQLPTASRMRPKASAPDKADDNRLSYSIQKLLSVYETSTTEKSPDGQRSRGAQDKRTKIYTRPSRCNLNAVADARGSSRKNSPLNAEKIPKRRASLLPRLSAEVKDSCVRGKKTEELANRRPAKGQQKPSSYAGKSESSGKGKISDKQTERCEELIPLLAPDRTAHSPVGLINSFIANYLEGPAQPSDADRKLDFLFPETSGNAFPVCDKRTANNIPRSGRALSDVKGSAGELVLMLRRRNSEPYSAKNCILQCTPPEGDDRLPSLASGAWGFGCGAVENFYFWETGVSRANKPYWEVSLFRSNKSLTVLNCDDRPLPLASPTDTGDAYSGGSFGARNDPAARMPPFADFNSCSSHVRTIPFLTLLERGRGLPREAGLKAADEDKSRLWEAGSRRISKDDHYKPPARLLVYVKSSQKKFVRSDPKRSLGEKLANKKTHKIKKIFAVGSETRGTSCHRHILLAVASAVFLVTGGLAFFLYFLARRHPIFNLTPPIPGLLRGC